MCFANSLHHIISSSHYTVWTELEGFYLRLQKKDALNDYATDIIVVKRSSKNQVSEYVQLCLSQPD
jgi:hypothetical protein